MVATGEEPRDPRARIAVGGPKGVLQRAYGDSYKPLDGPLIRPGWNGDGEPRRRVAYGRIRPGYRDWVAYMHAEGDA